jgi:hypothetical protein
MMSTRLLFEWIRHDNLPSLDLSRAHRQGSVARGGAAFDEADALP